MTIRLLVVDDHPMVRSGIGFLVQDTEIEIIGEAASGEEAVQRVQELQPDVVLIDIQMDNGDGLTALGKIKAERPHLPILVLSTFDNPLYVGQAMALGASGYLLKGCERDDILQAITRAAAGKSAWTRSEIRRVSGALSTPRLPDIEVPLTEREAEVLRLLALGKTNKQIAKSLDISFETVKEHVQHILNKVGVSDRTQAAVWAVREGLV